MLSTRVRIALLIEAAAWAAVAAALVRAGWSAAAGLAVFAALFPGVRLAVVLASFALAARHRPARAPGERIGFAGALRMVLGEWKALVVLSLAHLPWDRAFLRPDPTPSPEDVPVVLAHGYLANRGYWVAMVRRLEAAGARSVFVPSLPAALVSIERYEEALAGVIERVASAAGRPVVVIAHSMGGLGTRGYLARHGAARIARLVTLATPHHGTALAGWGVGENARQMRRGSVFLETLERAEGEGPGIPALSIYSPHDNLVVPPETCRLPWARNVAVPGRGHIEIAERDDVIALVLAELREAGALAAPGGG